MLIMKCSYAVSAYRLAFLHLLLCAVVSSVATSNSSAFGSVTLKSRSTHVSCEVKLTRCDERVQSTLLFSPPVNKLQVFVEMHQNISTSQYLWSEATMNWNLPDYSESLLGFLVHLKTSDELLNQCYLLSFPWTTPAEDPQFEFRLPLEPNIYTVRVHSYVESSSVHGSPHTVPPRTIVVKSRRNEFRNIPALWVTDLVMFNNSCARSVTISFELAPAAYNFSAYSVSLRQPGSIVTNLSTKLRVGNSQRQGTVQFSDVAPGNYTVEVTPENTDWNNTKLCRCRCQGLRTEFCFRKSCPDFGCVAIRSNVISIHNVNASDCYSTTDDPLLQTKITGIAVGCFTAAGIIALFIWILLRPKHIEINLNSLENQKVFLLYCTDHPVHYNVIHCLIHFLTHHCKCSVRTMRDDEHLISQNSFIYINDVCTGNDKILLINSDGVVQNFQNPQSVSSDPLDPMVQRFLEHLSPGRIGKNENHKLTIARFDYTKTNDIARRINYRQHEYLLMQEVEALVLHVHGFEKRKGRCVYHMKAVQESLNNSSEGKGLSSAMSSAKCFTENCDLLIKSPNQIQEHISDFSDEEQEVDGQHSGLLADGCGWEPAAETCARQPAGNSYVREPVMEFDVKETVDELYIREQIGEISITEPADELELLQVKLIPPSVDSSSLYSDGETQQWSNEINAQFDSSGYTSGYTSVCTSGCTSGYISGYTITSTE